MAEMNTPAGQTAPQQTALSAFSDELASVVERAGRSIVTVSARPRQAATGILWNAGGETVVLTADHVVEREDDITIALPDGHEVKATLAGRDPGTDLAVLKLNGAELGANAAPAELSQDLKVGHLVLAVGRPASDGPRVSFGAVSSIEGPRRSRQGGEIEGIIFPDVTLYPGFSGGPLVNLAGQVVGLNTSRLTRQNSAALPVATLQRVTTTLLTHGRVRRGFLGVGTQQVPLPAALAQKAGVTQETAVLVVSVEPNSPAEQSGLLLGDLIIAMNGQPILDTEALRAQLGQETVGKQTPVKIIRGGEARDLTVTVAERS